MKLSEDILYRGLLKDKTFSDAAWLDEPKTFYLGVDCSSDSLTVGNLAVLILARRLRDAGWKTILLVGGATSLIGDPGGKDEERELKSEEEINHNVAAIREQVKALFEGEDFTLVNNYDWHKDIKYLDFLRDIGKNFSMTELTQRDFISERMGEQGTGISYAEFSYTLIQGYDFWYLHKNYDAVLQIGGSDQWGNMLSGVALLRKKDNATAHVFSMPLVINKITGKKFGKSEDGAVWLDPNKTSVYKFYQFWLNVGDENVFDYLKIYTTLSSDEIGVEEQKFQESPEARSAQKLLALKVTELTHGVERAQSVKKISEVLFGGQSYDSLNTTDMQLLANELPVVEPDGALPELLVKGGLATSNSEARRLIEEGAVYINGQQIDNSADINAITGLQGFQIIRRGKNQHMLIKIS